MIGKITKGSEFAGCVAYVLREDKARLLASEGVPSDISPSVSPLRMVTACEAMTD